MMTNYERMPRTKIAAYMKQFRRYLQGHIGNEAGLERVFVSRMREQLLEFTPFKREDALLDFRGGWNNEEKALVFDAQGNLLTEVRPSGWYSSGEKTLWEKLRAPRHEGETVKAAIERLPQPKLAATVVLLKRDWKGPWEEVILFKTPKNFPAILPWLEELRRHSESEVSNELTKIDSYAAR